MSPEQRAYCDEVAINGVASMVQRLGRKWIVRDFLSIRHPGVFATKQEAVVAVLEMIRAYKRYEAGS